MRNGALGAIFGSSYSDPLPFYAGTEIACAEAVGAIEFLSALRTESRMRKNKLLKKYSCGAVDLSFAVHSGRRSAMVAVKRNLCGRAPMDTTLPGAQQNLAFGRSSKTGGGG